MTTLYRPVLIESAEQADALPAGTVWPHVDLFEEWTALVPIEAGTEYRPDTTAIRPWGETTPHPLPEKFRYVTEWEDA